MKNKIARSEIGPNLVVQTYKTFVQYLLYAFRCGYWIETKKFQLHRYYISEYNININLLIDTEP